MSPVLSVRGGRGRLGPREHPETGVPVSKAWFAFLLIADRDRPNSSAPEPRPPICWLPAVRFSSSDRGRSVGRAREWHSRGRPIDRPGSTRFLNDLA